MSRIQHFRMIGYIGVVILLSLTLFLGACGESATALPASTTPPTATIATSATTPTTIPATTSAATATPVLIPTNTPAPTTAPATATPPPTTAPATTTAIASTAATRTITPALATSNEVLPFSADMAYNQVKVLANDIGIRAAGSENQKKAGTYIAGQFEGVGLKSSFQESSFVWSRDNGSTLTLLNENTAIPVKARLVAFNEKIAPAQFEAEVAYLDSGSVDPATLAGKIVIYKTGNSDISNVITKALAEPEGSRPLALLVMSSAPDPLFPPALSKAPVPVCYLSDQATISTLTQQAKQNSVKVKLDVRWESNPITIRNVTGVRPALDGSNDGPIIIIGGHYDSVPEGPGANDNGSGTAITIELARSLAKAYPKIEFRFVAFDGEELGLIGSRDYVSKLSASEKNRIQGMINIDMVSVGKTLSVMGSSKWAGIAKGVALDLGYRDVDVQATDRAGGGSDHASFAQAKIPYITFDRGNDPNYHRSTDTPDKFTPQSLDQVAQIVLGTIQRFLTTQG